MELNFEPKIFYCRIGWMEKYSGIINNDKPIHGGSYTKDNIGHEVYNFLECDGKYYGYVENKSIHIERLGASRNEDKIDNVLVIWFAKAPKGGQKIVGWYKNATVYRHRQKIPEQVVASREIKDVVEYYVFSDQATLLEPSERIMEVSGSGRSNTWFADQEKDEEFNKKVWEYVQEYDNNLDNRLCELENGTENLEGSSKEAVVKVRINQDKFRKQLLKKYKQCCLCGVSNPDLLISSHIKPWSKSDKWEKLDINNGLLLCPNHDKLFDSGLISFNDDGTIIVSDKISHNDRIFMNVNPKAQIEVTEGNRIYIKYHREHILK